MNVEDLTDTATLVRDRFQFAAKDCREHQRMSAAPSVSRRRDQRVVLDMRLDDFLDDVWGAWLVDGKEQEVGGIGVGGKDPFKDRSRLSMFVVWVDYGTNAVTGYLSSN